MASSGTNIVFSGDSNQGIQIGLNNGTINCSSNTEPSKFISGIIPLRGDLWGSRYPGMGSNESYAEELTSWLSVVPHIEHHKTEFNDLLPGSGAWLFQRSEFIEWRYSISSSILWLHGTVGCGKSKLVDILTVTSSAVINHLTHNDTTPIAYFYCVRGEDETGRANPDEILRCILKQLFWNTVSAQIREPVMKRYREKQREGDNQGCQPIKLTVSESVELMIALAEHSPAIIIIDALDECDPKRRHELLWAIFEITKRSIRPTKVFITSREDNDIVCRLKHSPNIEIHASDNSKDIEQFVKTKIAHSIKEKQLLSGDISDELGDWITTTLVKGAQGMFLWVSLQIQNICDWERIKHEEDIRQELGRLPKSLNPLYAMILHRILSSGVTSRLIAEGAFKWLLCAQRPLRTSELIAAVSMVSDGKYLPLSKNNLLDMCCNMVMLDEELDVFRFAHLSVREYLEGRKDYAAIEAHTLVLKRCIEIHNATPTQDPPPDLKVKQDIILEPYSTLYWPVHCQCIGVDHLRADLKGQVGRFLLQDAHSTSSFLKWMHSAKNMIRLLAWHDPLRGKLSDSFSSPPTSLFLACCFGLDWIIDELQSFEKFCWNQQNDSNHSALYIAASLGHEVLVQVLLEKGVDIEAKGWSEGTALFAAAWKGHEIIVQLLLEKGADVNAKDDEGMTALMVAAEHGHQQLVSLLLKHDARVDELCEDEWMTALQRSAMHGHEAVVRLLLEKGADIKMGEYFDDTAMHLAAAHGHQAVVETLLEYGADIEAKNKEGQTALFKAVESKNAALVSLLLLRGANTGVTSDDWESVLHVAARSSSPAVVTLLLEQGAKIEAKWHYCRETALHLAAWAQQRDVMQLLLDRGANVNATDSAGETALHHAAFWGSRAVAQLLLENKADMNAKNNSGETALHQVAEWGHGRMLLRQCSVHWTERETVMRLLVKMGADGNAKDNSGESVLQRAAKNGHKLMVELLVERDAKTKRTNEIGETALILAARNGHWEVVQVLLANEMDTLAKIRDGQKAMIMAMRKQHQGAVEMLLRNGVRRVLRRPSARVRL